jgi:copper chaperone NosL
MAGDRWPNDMNHRPILFGCGMLALAGLVAAVSRPWTLQPSTTTGNIVAETARCPVCGMWVDRYAAWTATIRYEDNRLVCFDGVKDLFKYYFDIQRYDPKESIQRIQSLQVTDYYSLHAIDGYRAQYVIGSDVLGPMGHELIPLATEPAAREFLRDHRGQRIVTFQEVTREMISHLE